MQWSKAVLSKIEAAKTVMEFTPQKIDLGTPSAALEYLQRKPGTDFRMNEHVQVHTGVDKLEQVSDTERIEKRALEMLAEIQQNAYQEAHKLGMDEGRQRAFTEVSAAIAEKMDGLERLIGAITTLKSEMVQQNEAHLIKLLYHMASRIAAAHIEKTDESIVEILRQAVSHAQAEENIRVEMNPTQIEFVEELRKQSGREFEFLRKVRLESNDSIQPGGCLIETNYGEVDARIETRLEKLWETLSEGIPKVKDKISG